MHFILKGKKDCSIKLQESGGVYRICHVVFVLIIYAQLKA